ncbi:acyl-CoA dehydratase activase [Porcipelethomonas ammoniilytica]|uniref:acyl-CoA dehydratase activase-related protein n=1 Tax=Porcipelethomonas ammoniilytica TaxID=2981722 RepID=UPI000820CE2E|nr:acyl-CoA dehydratase activase-related protein [Porcipelethomonas ammoniilytica]MCU6719542.1 acyl-CoA dehydratase activase [Porcipelethomonas ammoniilytica]SCI84487.1 2-hydroxyglutaryl-CoA dehydratase component A [uncultured Ruminococcus sp.]
MAIYSLGIDVGSTTVKTVIIDEKKNIIYSEYQRHFSKVRETVKTQLEAVQEKYPNDTFKICMTGSAGLGLATGAEIPFVQEVNSAFIAVKERIPDADAVIELGGEDAKIIFLTGGVEQRMNGSCAGGTGAFIDQMATLLGVTVTEMDNMSLCAQKVYPIASRCGVFAKSDIQPLLNQGAKREDICASIFQAVVDQTVSGLAQGRIIEGKVLFLGGPLSFLKGLRKAFVDTLGLKEGETAVFPKEAPVFVALGCALFAFNSHDDFTIESVIKKIENAKTGNGIVTGQPLFNSKAEYEEFILRHKKCDLEYADLHTYKGNAYLGIDAGSTTTKLILITEDCRILYQHYSSNKGQPLDRIADKLKKIYSEMNPEIKIAGSAVTGYGEDLIKAGLSIDFGIVETVAHFKAASYFCPEVDFIIDIGGQDIKCFKIKNHSIDSIMLNEACSSGCGSFIQTFALALGYDIADFASLGLFAENPVDLGSRCTVFMNSSVKQAQKDGATVEDISAGLSSSIIKNAVYKVIRAKSPEELGKNIVVQGGTFLNDAVLRAFEMEMGRNVIRPAISGLMGAFGAALYAKEKTNGSSSTISKELLENFSYTSKSAQCGGCTAKCGLNIITFADGRKFISGNRCERGAGKAVSSENESLYDFKYNLLLSMFEQHVENPKAKVGLPLALNFYELIPFWKTLFNELGFETIISDESSRDIYYLGQHTIPSDTVCYPAKLTHGHIESLLNKNVDFIFYPCMSYNIDEGESDNHFNCPVVAYYPELLIANNPRLNSNNFIYPYMDLNREKNVTSVMYEILKKYGIKKPQVKQAVKKSYEKLADYRNEIFNRGNQIISKARENGQKIIVLSGRPYHIDKEINHGIQKLITSLGMAVVSEDAVFQYGHYPNPGVLNQWSYHARLYRAAQYVTTQPDMQLVQLVSFGCGIDAITTDEVREILESKGKLYTQLKIDEINNLGAAKIRLRSLVAAIEEK